MGTVTEVGSLYSRPVGYVYIFNLIVGAGVLAMPKAFSDVGWVLGIVLLAILAFMSFVTSTMMVEAMAAGNAVLLLRKQRREFERAPSERSRLLPYASSSVRDRSPSSAKGRLSPPPVHNLQHSTREEMADSGDHDECAASLYEIKDRVEMGTLAKLFFNRVGVVLYYVCICVYLYGDLAIYAVAIPKALVNVVCTPLNSTHHGNGTGNGTLNATDFDYSFDEPANLYGDDYYPGVGGVMSWISHPNKTSKDHYCFGYITDHRAYWIFLGCFALFLGPFTFFDLQKTKWLQLGTTVLRWAAFISMIALAGRQIVRDDPIKLTNAADFKMVPTMFGVSVYSFMCQHSLPSLVTPIKRKRGLSWILLGDFGTTLIFYIMVNFTAVFAFHSYELEDEYSNNFVVGSIAPKGMSYFLRLFPVMVLSTNFPIISITLRNNLKSLFLDPGKSYSFTVEKLVFPVAALLPPFIIAFTTKDLETLVGYTGSYAGVGVQYLIPIALVWCARRQLPEVTGGQYDNIHESPFSHRIWLLFVLVWSSACIIFNTLNHILSKK